MAPPVNAKKWVDEHRSMLDSVIGHKVKIRLNHILVATDTLLYAMTPELIGNIANPPEKRSGANDKMYTPPCFTLHFDQGPMVFTIEDTQIVILINNGVKLLIGNTTVEVYAVDAVN